MSRAESSRIRVDTRQPGRWPRRARYSGGRRWLDAALAIDMLGDDPHILSVARRLKEFVDAPVLGGIAVFLHGYTRTTKDLDFYTPDRKLTDVQLKAAGAVWDTKNREHVLESVRIHTVTPSDAGHEVRKTSIIQGIRVVSLADLIAIKLRCGLNNVGRGKDIGDVEELVRIIGLDKSFAPKLPKDLRQDYKDLVTRVRESERKGRTGPKF